MNWYLTSQTNQLSSYLELAQYPEKNKDALQKLVDEAAKKAGYNFGPVYHNSHSKNITVFLPYALELKNGDMTPDQVNEKLSKWREREKSGKHPGYMSFRAGTFFSIVDILPVAKARGF